MVRVQTLAGVLSVFILLTACSIVFAGGAKGTMFNLPNLQGSVEPITKNEIIEIRVQDLDGNNIKPLDETGKEFPEYGVDFRISVRGPAFSFTLPKVGNLRNRQVVNIQFFRSGFFGGATTSLTTQILQAVVIDDADNSILTFNISVPRPTETEKMQPSKLPPPPTFFYSCQPDAIVYPECICGQSSPRRCRLLRR